MHNETTGHTVCTHTAHSTRCNCTLPVGKRAIHVHDWTSQRQLTQVPKRQREQRIHYCTGKRIDLQSLQASETSELCRHSAVDCLIVRYLTAQTRRSRDHRDVISDVQLI
jgi:hypothetical protein